MVVLDRGNGLIERTEQRGELPADGAFVDVRIPAHEARRTHAGPSGCARYFAAVLGDVCDVFPNATNAWRRRFPSRSGIVSIPPVRARRG